MLFRLLIAAVGALLIGAAVATVIYTVCYKVMSGDLPWIIRDALNGSKEQKAKELLAKALEANVDKVEGNTISLSVFEKSSDSVVQISITGSEIDSNIYEGMRLSVPV